MNVIIIWDSRHENEIKTSSKQIMSVRPCAEERDELDYARGSMSNGTFTGHYEDIIYVYPLTVLGLSGQSHE